MAADGRLDALDKKEEGRALRPTIFSNIDGLYVFQVSAEDAEYLVEELGGGLEKDDLVELGDHHCYTRLSGTGNGEKLHAFSIHLDPPPAADAGVATELAARSARRYGRRRIDVEDDLHVAMARIELAGHQRHSDAVDDAATAPGGGQKARNENRPGKKVRPKPAGPSLLDSARGFGGADGAHWPPPADATSGGDGGNDRGRGQ